MKKQYLVILLLIPLAIFSQEYKIGMNVTKADLSTNIYSKDSTARAVIIYDYGNAFFDKESWFLNIENKQKIKILTKGGLDKGEIEIPLYESDYSKETLLNIKATTYNLVDGKIISTKLTENSIFREKNKNYTLVKFAFPNVKVGSVITFSYTKSTKFINKFQPWYFQQDIPTIYSEYNTSIPGNYEYNIKLVGSIPLTEEKMDIEYNCLQTGREASANCAISKYIMKEIPAYKEEVYSTTAKNYQSRIEYELSVVRNFNGEVNKITKTWGNVDKELKSDSNFGRQLSRKNLVKDILPASIKNIDNELKKAEAIYLYVLQNYKWNGIHGRNDVSIKRLIKNGGGNAFELNIFLENLLNNENINVLPMLLSTRDNGLATKVYPVITDFNYMILKTTINDNSYFLDATNPYLSFGEIPYKCLNQYGRVFDFDYASYWEDITVPKFSAFQIGAKLILNEDLQLAGHIKKTTTLYNSHSKKKNYSENPDLYLEKLKNSYKFSKIINHKKVSKITDPYFKEELDLILEEKFTENKIYFNPFIYTFFSNNPFKLKNRTYPIDFGYKQVYLFSMEIDLNNKYKVIENPKSVNMVLPNNSGSILFSVSEKNNVITLFFKIKFNNALYNAHLYEDIKMFMNKIIDIQNNTIIVLERN